MGERASTRAVAPPAGRRQPPDGTASAGRRHLRVVGPTATTAVQRAVVARRDLVLLWGSTGFLTAFGLVMVLSAGSVSATQGYEGNPFWYFQRQAIFAVIGVVAAVVVSRLRPSFWKAASLPLLGVAALLMLIAAHPTSGTSLYGASRWIDLGPVTLQPSELAKLGMVTFSATILAARWRRLDDPRQLLLPLGPVVVVVAGLGIAQSDLGTTVIIVAIVLAMLFVAGVRIRYLAVAGALTAVAGTALIIGETYRRTRLLEAWVDPWSDPQGNGYQLIQGLIAFGSGGWLGTGLGTSRAKWDFLPNAHSDFIFAVIGEELGLLGALAIVLAFAVVVLAGVRIAIHARGTFERLLAAGITAWICVQAVINLGAVTGLLPITGIPLPLVSFGGSALVLTLIGVGVLASIARVQTRTARRSRGAAGRSTREAGAKASS